MGVTRDNAAAVVNDGVDQAGVTASGELLTYVTGNVTVKGSVATGSGTAGSLNADLIASTDCGTPGYQWVSIHITGTFTGTLTFQVSNDNSNWISCAMSRPDFTATTAFTTNTSSSVMIVGSIPGRYFRARMTAYTSGTANCQYAFFTTPFPYTLQQVFVSNSVTTTWTSNTSAEDAASAAGETLLRTGWIRRDTPVANANASADADWIHPIADNMGKLWVAGVHKEDSASASGDRGMAVHAVQRSVLSVPGNDGDYVCLVVDSFGRLKTRNHIEYDFNSADTFTAAGNGVYVATAGSVTNLVPYQSFALQVVGTGATATAWDVVLEGSIDGVNYTTLIQHGTADGNGTTKWASDKIVEYVRTRCVSLTLGTATNIKAWFITRA
jgi:hypothetical protein